MTLNEYQTMAARTIAPEMDRPEQEDHALHGMVAEIGELHALYQKTYQGHAMDPIHQKKEVGDLLWFLAEYCTSQGWTLEEVATLNITKLMARYPDGFSPDRSLNREDGDV